MESADQWAETSFTVMGNRIFRTDIDRKCGQYEEMKGVSIEEFLADRGVQEHSKAWIRELVATYTIST